ncbi:UvrD-helicase domain-containing protein [Candidatus Nomurabacteria bacterium]|nr:UvrD-helicase domain-containing protein [Candidatus Nomurabacteria bacterium]
MDILEGLNPAQREAVETTRGPLLILAGAGSGKTKTLTHRIAYLITKESVWPSQILAVTFTNKAAKEMRSRLWWILKPSEAESSVIPRDFMPWMGTFHSICVRLLRIDGERIGVPRNFVIFDEDDRLGLIKRAMKRLSISDKQVKPRAVSSAISSAKNKLETPDEYESSAKLPFQKAVAEVYREYEKSRKAANGLDFDDLILQTVDLLRNDSDIRAKWQQTFQYIFIDEYQDTNAAQYALVKLLVNSDQNICVVGDDWQSIYSFRNADFTNILNFERDFAGAKVVKLEENYRSTGAILEAAQSVILKNTERTDKKLFTSLGRGEPVEVKGVYDEAEEAFFVAQTIRNSVASGKRQYSDFAVLYRMNAQSYTFERAFLQARIPYQIVGGVRFYDRREVRDVIAYLRLLYQPQDVVSFRRIANVPTRGIGNTSLEKFLVWQQATGLDILSAMRGADQASTLTPRARKAIKELGSILSIIGVQIEDGLPPSEIINTLIERIRYRDFLNDGSAGSEDRIENLETLMADAQQFASVEAFLEEVALLSSQDTETSSDNVTLMTLHAAKGLEFPVVFMVGLEEGIFPHSRVFDQGRSELEEERRLCYVGMTRAREELYLLHAASRLQFGQRAYGSPSRFLADMGCNVGSADEQFAAPPEYDDFSMEMPFDIDDRVRSPQFGDGIVVDIDGMAVSVDFDSGQNKKLNVEFARLQKL